MAYIQGEVIVPVVNSNGKSAEALIEEYSAVLHALDKTIDAMKQITPHGRDYQTEPREVYDEAVDQHRARMGLLAIMHKEIEGIALAVYDQKRK